MLVAISQICKNFTAEKFHELSSLAYSISYMEVERKALQAAFERFEQLKRASAKQAAWERVIDQVFRLHTIADSAIFCKSKKE